MFDPRSGNQPPKPKKTQLWVPRGVGQRGDPAGRTRDVVIHTVLFDFKAKAVLAKVPKCPFRMEDTWVLVHLRVNFCSSVGRAVRM